MKILRVITFSSLLLTLLSSCTTNSSTTQPVTSESLPPPPREAWVLVSEDPVTYFPKGFPKDANTDISHGEWVRAGDRDAIYFIPKGGVENRSEQELMVEAFSMRTKSQNEKTAQGNREANRRKQNRGMSAADALGYEMLRAYRHSDQYRQQQDQAWIDSH